MKRFPNGVTGLAFYQHKVAERGAAQFVGGSLKTLLEMTQLAAISQDPWFSRVPSPADADYTAIDLDPTETATFATVLDVARWVRDELRWAESARLPENIGIARPAHLHPAASGDVVRVRHALLPDRRNRRRDAASESGDGRTHCRAAAEGHGLHRLPAEHRGQDLATAYSARATTFAGVSTPLTWKELDMKLDPRDFTMHTAPARFRQVGDLWAGLRTAPPADLEAVLRKY